jgi:hypothetical protein
MTFTERTYRAAFRRHYKAAKGCHQWWHRHHTTYMLIYRRARQRGITL